MGVLDLADRAWPPLTHLTGAHVALRATYPTFDTGRGRTGREIPIVVLERRPDRAGSAP